MRQLMISLDKKILESNSAVAQRMIEYGKKDELFIIIPDREKKSLDLNDTVHVQTTGGKFKIVQFINLYLLGKKLIKYLILNIKYSLITAQDPFFTGLVGFLLKKKFKINLEVQMHGDFFSGYYKKQLLKLCLAKFVLKRADKLRVVGERVKQSLLRLGIAENKIIVRPVPVDFESIRNYQPRIDLHQKYPGYEKIFLVLGRLDAVKNVEWLIDVFREVVTQRKNWLLLIVGDGQKEQNFKLSRSERDPAVAGQDNIKFENWNADAWSYFKTADCILFPSLSEGYGLVPMEAHAAGTPIIMNDVGVANYELKPSEKVEPQCNIGAEPRTVQQVGGTGAWVKILPINDREKWIDAILINL